MRPRTRAGRAAACFLLLAGSGIYLFPFLWMASTAVKPIEQTMSIPPRWVPRVWYARLGGERRMVTRDYRVEQPSVLVRLAEGPRTGERVLVPVDEWDGRAVRRNVSGILEWVPADLERTVAAGMWRVTERLSPTERGREPLWDVLPGDEIEEHIRFFWENFREAVTRIPFLRYLRNTLVVCVLSALGAVLSSSLVAYSLAKIPWRGRNLLFAMTLATMMIPFAVLMVPLYAVFAWLGWIGTLKPLWVPAFFGNAFFIFLMRQFFLTIPGELSEAARIDGCSEFGIYWRIVLPLSRPVLAVVALFQFLYAWNDFMGPLLYLTRQETFTLSLGLQFFQSQHGGTDWSLLMAASTLVVIPVVVLFFFTQKQFIQGISTTGLRG